MIRRVKLSKGDVLVVSDHNGNEILFAALKSDDQYPKDNELLLRLECDKNTGYNRSHSASMMIAKLLNPDIED